MTRIGSPAKEKKTSYGNGVSGKESQPDSNSKKGLGGEVVSQE